MIMLLFYANFATAASIALVVAEDEAHDDSIG
jgi:hypothetical protein